MGETDVHLIIFFVSGVNTLFVWPVGGPIPGIPLKFNLVVIGLLTPDITNIIRIIIIRKNKRVVWVSVLCLE
jgi:hypothetical protein